MRVCYFGTYDRDYIRNRVIIEGLRANGVEVVECHVPLWRGTEHKIRTVERGPLRPGLIGRMLGGYLRLLRRYLRVGRHDALIVGYAGHFDVFLAKLLTALGRRPLIFDAFLSLHDTLVLDRGLVRPNSLLAKLIYLADKYACLVADLVLLDTNAHIEHFRAKFGVRAGKFRCVPVGADDKCYRPLPKNGEDGLFKVLYFGKYIPLHGVEYIVRAAKELEGCADITFEFIGKGQRYGAVRAMADELDLGNISWVEEWLDPPALARRIAEADVCLGIFGTSEKAKLVIPTKVYVALAMGKPVITGDSPAAREVLVSGDNALLCEMGNSQALAKAILLLKRDAQLRQRLAERGYKCFRERFSPKAIGAEVKESLIKLLSK